jgi:hypothetical protein
MDHEKQLHDPIPVETPSSENVEDHGSPLTEKATQLKSPKYSGLTHDKSKRASYAQPTQSSKARQGGKDVHQSASPTGSVLTSPLTSTLTSPLTSPTSSSTPRFHRYRGSADITPRILTSHPPRHGKSRSISSLVDITKSPKQHKAQGLRKKVSQPILNHPHNHSDSLKPSTESEEPGTELEVRIGHGTANLPVESHGDYEVQPYGASVIGNRLHDENRSLGLETTEKATMSEKLEALPRLMVPMEESSRRGTKQATIASPTSEQVTEDLTRILELPELVARDEHDKLQYEMLELNNELIAELEEEIEALNYSLRVKNKEIDVRNGSLCVQNEKIEELNKSLHTEIENVRMSEETLGKLREDFAALTNAAKHVLRRNIADTSLDPNMLESVPESTNSSLEAEALYSAFLQIVHKLDVKLRTVSAQSDKHREDSAAKKRRLEIVEKALEATQEREKLAVSEGLKSKEDLEIWKRRYEDEGKQKDKAQRDYQSFKKTAEEMYRPDLERTNTKLQLNLVAAKNENIRLQERVKEYKLQVQNWEDEYNIIKAKAEKVHVGLEKEIERQKDEMVVYIKDYHDKREANSHWDVENLQQRNSKLERDNQATTKLLNTIRQEKVQLEQNVIPGYLDSIASIREENKKLKDEWARNQHALPVRTNAKSAELRPDQPLPLDALLEGKITEQEDTTVKTSELSSDISRLAGPHQGLHIPRCLHPTETAQRNTELDQLRQRQQKRRGDRARMNDYLENIIDKARRWKMGEELYEKKGWIDFVGHSSWEIWDGDSWMYHADKKDIKVVMALRDKGALPQETKEEDKVPPAAVGTVPSALPWMAELWGDYTGIL